MLKAVLVGVGGISGAHIPAWRLIPEAELTAICDIRPERLAKYPDLRGYTDFDEMLEEEQPDLLDICLPTYLHTAFALKAMARGIHVICEKPISLCKEDVALLYDTAAKNGVKLMVAQVLRFWKEYQTVRDFYQSGTYGKLLSGSMWRIGHLPRWSWDNWMLDEARSGLVPFDLHIHDLDFLVWAFGAPQNSAARRVRRPEQDYLRATYEYDGFFVSVEAAWYAAEYPFTAGFRFQFEKALAAYENGVLTVYDAAGNRTEPCAVSAADTGGIELPKTPAYYNEIRYFVDCVLADRPAEKVKPAELETVISLLKSIQ